MTDSLAEIFELQGRLNANVGHNTNAVAATIKSNSVVGASMAVAGAWINDYIAAMSSELEELRDCTFWKHWCAEAKAGRRFELHDLDNARVEVIDLLFFWVSLAQCVGLTAEDCLNLYRQKWQVNIERQASGYAMSTKDEADNDSVRL